MSILQLVYGIGIFGSCKGKNEERSFYSVIVGVINSGHAINPYRAILKTHV